MPRVLARDDVGPCGAASGLSRAAGWGGCTWAELVYEQAKRGFPGAELVDEQAKRGFPGAELVDEQAKRGVPGAELVDEQAKRGVSRKLRGRARRRRWGVEGSRSR